jgi:hypothetical protein
MTTMIPAPNNSEAPNNWPLLGWEKEGQRRRRRRWWWWWKRMIITIDDMMRRRRRRKRRRKGVGLKNCSTNSYVLPTVP